MSNNLSLLPNNQTPFEAAFESVIDQAFQIPVNIDQLYNPQFCPTHLLGFLAWALSVDEWDTNWSDEDKREVIRQSVAVHRHKGTVSAVKTALRSAGYDDATIVEHHGRDFHNGVHLHDGSITYAPADHWAEYRVTLARPISIEQAAQVRSILKKVAPARSHLKALDFTQAQNLHNNEIIYDGSYTRGTV